jgi:hypothetical protein
LATAFNNIDIFVTNADEKQNENEDGGYRRLWQP